MKNHTSNKKDGKKVTNRRVTSLWLMKYFVISLLVTIVSLGIYFYAGALLLGTTVGSLIALILSTGPTIINWVILAYYQKNATRQVKGVLRIMFVVLPQMIILITIELVQILSYDMTAFFLYPIQTLFRESSADAFIPWFFAQYMFAPAILLELLSCTMEKTGLYSNEVS